jgi:hypothetical protein
MIHFLDEPAAKSFAISSPMAVHFSSLKRHRCCLIGLEPDLIFKACWATSLGMLGMSGGIHAKMSLLARRKSMKALSYLGESVVPMSTFLSLELSGMMRISLTLPASSKEAQGRQSRGGST